MQQTTANSKSVQIVHQQVHKVPDSQFENNVTRFDLPTGAVAYGPDGKLLAAACDDGTIKLVEVADKRVWASDFQTRPAENMMRCSALRPFPGVQKPQRSMVSCNFTSSIQHIARRLHLPGHQNAGGGPWRGERGI